MNVLYQMYGDKVQFLWVYIREAHPSDGNWVQVNIDEGIILPTPLTLAARENYANQAADYLGIEFASVIDTMDDQVESLYAAWPLRLYLVGTDGNLVYVGGAGPRNYAPAELETAMQQHLGLDGVASVSAASFANSFAAPESIVSGFGGNLALGTESATSADLPTTLAGMTVTITDAQGTEHPAPLFMASPQQTNYLVPTETALGPAVVTIRTAQQEVLRGPLLIKNTAPAVFTANANGTGVAAAHAVHVAADGTQTWNLVSEYDDAVGAFVAAPVDLGAETEQVVLVLYGTGIRNASEVRVTMGGENAEDVWFGPQGQYPGLDQVNALIPRSMAGRLMNVVVEADGEIANAVQVMVGP